MHIPKPLLLYNFADAQNPLVSIVSPQSTYLKGYLKGLHVKTVIEEQNYFDRDYLSEFAEFYSRSSRGYPNICRRLHFFSTSKIDEALLCKALEDSKPEQNILKSSYLGFLVIRPIPAAPLGRTVLKWFKDNEPESPRITAPSRLYSCNLAGIHLETTSLAWQQQDTGVSACATVSLWTMLHSSAFDDHHAIPTTAEITKSAHLNASLGDRVFPSKGLNTYQILEAIKEQDLAPAMTAGDLIVNLDGQTKVQCFSKKKLASSCAAFIRSGYPVLLLGRYIHHQSNVGHMVCAVGFRDSSAYDVQPGEYAIFDEAADTIYIHDDNIGPNVRCRILEDYKSRAAILVTDPPAYASECESASQIEFLAESIVVAVHEELRISSDKFFVEGLGKVDLISRLLNIAYANSGKQLPKLLFSTQFLNIRSYQGEELSRHFGPNNAVLGVVRRSLAETIPPLSLHIGLLRIAIDNGGVSLLMDVLYDTTDSDRSRPVFAHIIYDQGLYNILLPAATYVRDHFGEQIQGF